MAESAHLHGQTGATASTGPSSLEGTVDPEGLSTVHEISRLSADYDGNGSPNNHSFSKPRLQHRSPDASLDSSTRHSYNEKPSDDPPKRLRHTDITPAARQTWRHSEASPVPLRNGIGHENGYKSRSNTHPGVYRKSTMQKKQKTSGFRYTLRRIFGRRSAGARSSMPDSAVYPRHDPEEFITSATDVKAKRIESPPTHTFLRTSGLNSHPPHQRTPEPPSTADKPPTLPPPSQPERRPPERPPRPRSASVPSLILNRQEMEAIDAGAVTGLGLQSSEEQTVDTQNIGFAVTNGSNPRRRSRSVGAFRDSEHRMSPIQWRRWRRRSDEIRYWRASSDLTSFGLQGFDLPEMNRNEANNTVAGDHDRDAVEHNGNFSFRLPADTIDNQERVGLEERIVTLEIKLMDFEYALSKLQAKSPAREHSGQTGVSDRQESTDSYFARPNNSVEPSPSIPQETPPMVSSQWVKDFAPSQRPTSVATTLKPGHSAPPIRKKSIDRSTRSSLMGLTIDHYTTLITLIRNEQSSRQRLEQQVSILQGRIDAMSSPYPHSHAHSFSQQSHSHSRSLSSSQRRQGYIDLRGRGQAKQLRPRSSSYSTNETDTDDDAFHDVYVTPDVTPVELERGEYERGVFDRVAGVEEGMAF